MELHAIRFVVLAIAGVLVAIGLVGVFASLLFTAIGKCNTCRSARTAPDFVGYKNCTYTFAGIFGLGATILIAFLF